jgi:hypothetical protein
VARKKKRQGDYSACGKSPGSRATQFGPGGVVLRREEEEAQVALLPDSSEPVDVAAEMDALLGRPKEQDRGDLQRQLRKWYERDFPGYMRHLAGLKGKGAGTGKGEAGADGAGAQAQDDEELPAERLYLKIVNEANQFAHISTAVADAWAGLSEQQRRTILDAAGIPHTVEAPDGSPLSLLHSA